MTDSLPGAILLAFSVPFLWFFGVHGSSIVGTVANGGHIVTRQFMDQFQTVTGGGMTIGIVLYICFFAKSMQNEPPRGKRA
jgi:PTS system cellobiose-specific IIC component